MTEADAIVIGERIIALAADRTLLTWAPAAIVAA
jgi:hypothetical protein